jgi:hypothetical protein
MVDEQELRNYIQFRHGKRDGAATSQGTRFVDGAATAVTVAGGPLHSALKTATGIVAGMLNGDEVPEQVHNSAVLECAAQLYMNGGRPADLEPIQRLLRPARGIGTVR